MPLSGIRVKGAIKPWLRAMSTANSSEKGTRHYGGAILLCMPVDYDAMVEWAKELPGVEETLAYGKPCVKREGRMMFAPSRVVGAVTVKLPWDLHDELLRTKPGMYFKREHYEGTPWILAWHSKLTAPEAKMLIRQSWEDAPNPAKNRRHK
jgi:hypothetical protein